METVYQLMLFPVEVPFNCAVPPGQTVVGETVTGVGAGTEVTVTETAVLAEGAQTPFEASA